MTTQVAFKTDAALKKKALQKALKKGVALTFVFNEFLKDFVEKDYEVVMFPPQDKIYYMSERTERAMEDFDKAKREGKTKQYKSGTDLMNNLLS
jgi:hypothetical protein